MPAFVGNTIDYCENAAPCREDCDALFHFPQCVAPLRALERLPRVLSIWSLAPIALHIALPVTQGKIIAIRTHVSTFFFFLTPSLLYFFFRRRLDETVEILALWLGRALGAGLSAR